MINQTQFRPYNPEQMLLLPQNMKEWLPEEDLVYFITDIVKTLDLKAIYQTYDNSKGGKPAYNPTMMTSLLVYAYCVGVYSSRKIEQATHHSIPFRVLSANQHPDHDTIAEFRKRHLEVLAKLFVQVLQLCQKAGLVKLGHIALDGSKIKANASQHKAMSYSRMEKKAAELKAEVDCLLAQAESTDAQEDSRYGKGKKSDELPRELRFRKTRLEKIEQAKKALEEEARQGAQAKKSEYEEKLQAYKSKKGRRGKAPKPPTEKPDPHAQRNFTDPESRIMPSHGKGNFVQGYNCQAAVDEKKQIIVATTVTQQTNDKQQLAPMVEKLKQTLAGDKPKILSADSGYVSENNCSILEQEGIDGHIATQKQKHGAEPLPPPRGRIRQNTTLVERMARKLRTKLGRSIYKKRKQIVEPVFGQIKQVRGFRQFSMRGIFKCQCEWDLVCLTHNLLKLFRSGWRVATV
jgi:transposase